MSGLHVRAYACLLVCLLILFLSEDRDKFLQDPRIIENSSTRGDELKDSALGVAGVGGPVSGNIRNHPDKEIGSEPRDENDSQEKSGAEVEYDYVPPKERHAMPNHHCVWKGTSGKLNYGNGLFEYNRILEAYTTPSEVVQALTLPCSSSNPATASGECQESRRRPIHLIIFGDSHSRFFTMSLIMMLDKTGMKGGSFFKWANETNHWPHLGFFDVVLRGDEVLYSSSASPVSKETLESMGEITLRATFHWSTFTDELPTQLSMNLHDSSWRRFVFWQDGQWDVDKHNFHAAFGQYCSRGVQKLADICKKEGLICVMGLMPQFTDIVSAKIYMASEEMRTRCTSSSASVSTAITMIDFNAIWEVIKTEQGDPPGTDNHWSHFGYTLFNQAVLRVWASRLRGQGCDVALAQDVIPKVKKIPQSDSMTTMTTRKLVFEQPCFRAYHKDRDWEKTMPCAGGPCGWANRFCSWRRST
eukprot:jgi/Bigna1/142676/aug1.72_g17384